MKKIFELIRALVIIVFSIFLVINAQDLSNTISVIIGIIIAVSSVGELLTYIKIKDKALIINGIIGIIVGLIIAFNETLLKNVFSFVMGIFIILDCIKRWKECNIYVTEKNNKVLIYKVFLILGIILGLVCILGKFIIPDMIIRLIGIVLFIYGIIEFINFFIIGTENDIENIA